MEKIILLMKALFIDRDAIKRLCDPNNKWKALGTFVTVLLGLIYGFTSIIIYQPLISSFDTPILRDTIIPALFLVFGIIMLFVTKVGFSLLLWAISKGLSGPGLLNIFYQNTTIALIPSVIALPAFISLQSGANLTTMMFLSIFISVIWIYLICSRIVEVTQKFVPWRAYVTVLIAFIFFISIYYITFPPPQA